MVQSFPNVPKDYQLQAITCTSISHWLALLPNLNPVLLQQRRHEDNQYQSLLRTLAGEELVQSIYPQFSRLLHTATTGCVTTEEPHATCNQSSHQGAKSYTSGAGPGPFDPLE